MNVPRRDRRTSTQSSLLFLLVSALIAVCVCEQSHAEDEAADERNTWPSFVQLDAAPAVKDSAFAALQLFVGSMDGRTPDLPSVLIGEEGGGEQRTVVSLIDSSGARVQSLSFDTPGDLYYSSRAPLLVRRSPQGEAGEECWRYAAYDLNGRKKWELAAEHGSGALSSTGYFAHISCYSVVRIDGRPTWPFGCSKIVSPSGAVVGLSGIGTTTSAVWSPQGDALYIISSSPWPTTSDTLCAYRPDGGRLWVRPGVGTVTRVRSEACGPLAAGRNCLACIGLEYAEPSVDLTREELMELHSRRFLRVFDASGELRWQDGDVCEAGPVSCAVSEDGSVVASTWQDEQVKRVIVRVYDCMTGDPLGQAAFPPWVPERGRFLATAIVLSPDGRLVCVSVKCSGGDEAGAVGVLTRTGELIAVTDELESPTCYWLDERTLVLQEGMNSYVTSFRAEQQEE